MLSEVPTFLSKMLTAVGMGTSFKPAKTSTALPYMDENSLLIIVVSIIQSLKALG